MKLLQSKFGVVTIILLISAVMYFSFLARYEFRPGISVAFNNTTYQCLKYVPNGIPLMAEGFGFDSADYWMIARDIFLTRDYSQCDGAENIAYNSQRWMYHFAVWSLALGEENYLKYSAPLLNLLSIFLLGLVWAQVFQIKKIHLAWTIPAVVNVGLWYGFRFNTADNFLFLLISSAFYFHLSRQTLLAMFFLMLAMLTRNVAIGMVLVLALASILERKDWKASVLYLASSVPYFTILMPFVRSRFPYINQVQTGLEYITIPFKTPVSQIMTLLENGEWARTILAISALLFLSFLLIYSIYWICRNRELRIEAMLIAGYTLTILSLENTGWGNGPFHVIRIISIIIPMMLLWLLSSSRKWDRSLAYPIAAYTLLGPLWLWMTPLVPLQ